MGLSSTITTSCYAVKMCVFDLRRGQQEGQELDKILFFYPLTCPSPHSFLLLALVKVLSPLQGKWKKYQEDIKAFLKSRCDTELLAEEVEDKIRIIFSPEAACEVIEAERHSHVFYQAESDIWMVMVVEKNRELEAIWRIEALRSVLKEIHSLFVMFNGSLRTALDAEPSGELLRSNLYTFITDYLCDFFAGKKLQLPSFRDSLRERGTVQALTIGREAAIEVQSLVRALESCAGNTQCQSLVLFHDLLVSTTLSPDDTVNLFTYAVLRMTPRALSSGASSWSNLHKGSSAIQVPPSYTTVPTTSSTASGQLYASRDTSLSSDSSRYLIGRPLQQGKWSKSGDGFLVADTSGADMQCLNSSAVTVFLQQSHERMFLCAHQHKNLTVIVLLPVVSINNVEQGISLVKQQILENASLKILKIEEKLSKGWGGENAYHVSGYRYLLLDGDRSVSRASPPAKVKTLAKESLAAMCKVREEVDLEKSRAKWEDEGHEKDLEVCIRAKNNAWVIARVTRGKELYMVLEKANETLLYASDATEKFSNRYCNGSFSLN